MAPPQTVSVVVVTRNRAARLAALLRTLGAQTRPGGDIELVIVDDDSDDETSRISAEAGADVVIVTDRPGLAELRNIGWKRASNELVCFIDDDCEADPTWLEELVASAHANPGAFIQGRTMPIDRELGAVGPLSRSKLIESAGPWFQTCNIAYPRDLLERLGGFDPHFSVAGEDTDLGWRSIESGADVVYAPGAVARHAVERIGAGGWLAIARRERLLVPLFARHPGLRRRVARAGFLKGDLRLRYALALAGLAMGRRFKPALLLTLPYLRLIAARCRADNAGPHWLGWYAALDTVSAAYALRGAVENRVPFV